MAEAVAEEQNGIESSSLDILDKENKERCLCLVVAYLEGKADTLHCPKISTSRSFRKRYPFLNICKPKISLRDYVHRLSKFTQASSVCFVLACSYIDRLSQIDDSFSPHQHAVHRLLLTGVLLAAKLTDDKFKSNSYFSRVGGVSQEVLNSMELAMFKRLDFNAYVSQSNVESQLHRMEEFIRSQASNSEVGRAGLQEGATTHHLPLSEEYQELAQSAISAYESSAELPTGTELTDRNSDRVDRNDTPEANESRFVSGAIQQGNSERLVSHVSIDSISGSETSNLEGSLSDNEAQEITPQHSSIDLTLLSKSESCAIELLAFERPASIVPPELL